MKSLTALGLVVALAGCNTAATGTPGNGAGNFQAPNLETAVGAGINRAPNTAPRGSAAFCQTYGQQSALNRVQSERGSGGRGPSGFDRARAAREGERAYQRCLAGRTN